MFVIHYEDSRAFAPCQARNFFCQGVFFRGDRIVSLQDLSPVNAESVREFLTATNGFFNFVIRAENSVYLAVDRIRSIPLFYAKINSDFYISNDANWLKDRMEAPGLDQLGRQEFLLTGYVTGQDTLFSEIKQVQAGELLVVEEKNDGYHITSEDYYTFLPEYSGITHEERDFYLAELDRISTNVIRRLVEFAAGRQVVIPLSAGRDSRLIGLKLKQLGYQNVVCFSYGKSGNFESRESKVIAEKLGYKWYFVEYLPELEKIIYGTEEGWQYQKYSGNLTSCPHFQDLIAVKVLKERGVLEADAVFCPGHTGDFAAGSHIPAGASRHTADAKDLTTAILAGHYVLFDFHRLDKGMRGEVVSKLASTLKGGPAIHSGVDMSRCFEAWEWRERQAKYIVNSVRVYEFYGFQWWMPLWDTEFIDFWQAVPFVHRREKKLYNEYVDGLSVKMLGYHTQEPSPARHLRRAIVAALSFLHLKEAAKRAVTCLVGNGIERQLQAHPNVSEELYRDVVDMYSIKGMRIFIGMNALLYLRSLERAEQCDSIHVLHI